MGPGTPVNSPGHFGYTRAGRPVHRRTTDHLPDDSAYQRFNKRVAVWLTSHVGTMTCFWLFLLLAFLSLPATLVLADLLPAPRTPFIYKFVMSYGFIFLIDWLCQNVIQLILLPGLMVGQNLQNAASDARADKQFADTETIADRLDTRTEGGLTDVLARVNTLDGQVGDLAETIRTVMAARAEHDSGVAADARAARSAAESAFVATQALAAIATTPPPAGSGGTAGPKPGAAR
jgi:hypothetical protein